MKIYEEELNGDVFSVYEKEDYENKPSIQRVDISYAPKESSYNGYKGSSSAFKVKSVEKPPKGSSTYFFYIGDEIIGHTSIELYEDNTAELCTLADHKFKQGIYIPSVTEYVYEIDKRAIDAILVRPEYQGQGLGTLFMRMTMEDLVKRGIPTLKVKGIVDAAKGFYEKLGIRFTNDNHKEGVFENLEEYLENNRDSGRN